MVVPQEMLPKTQKEDIKGRREYMRIKNEEYRNELKSGFNLLREWVPGTANLGRLKQFMVINYLYLLLLFYFPGQVLDSPMFGCLLSHAHAHYSQPFF